MRRITIILILAIIALGVSYKLGYLDKHINRYILKERLTKSNVSTLSANEAVTAHDASIQNLSSNSETNDNNATLYITLKNNTNKVHELIQIETDISDDVTFFEAFTKGGKTEIHEVFGVPVEGFSIVKLATDRRYMKIKAIKNMPRIGDSISIRLLFSDNSEKSIIATVVKGSTD